MIFFYRLEIAMLGLFVLSPAIRGLTKVSTQSMLRFAAFFIVIHNRYNDLSVTARLINAMIDKFAIFQIADPGKSYLHKLNKPC